jgi:hypothetical protein
MLRRESSTVDSRAAIARAARRSRQPGRRRSDFCAARAATSGRIALRCRCQQRWQSPGLCRANSPQLLHATVGARRLRGFGAWTTAATRRGGAVGAGRGGRLPRARTVARLARNSVAAGGTGAGSDAVIALRLYSMGTRCVRVEACAIRAIDRFSLGDRAPADGAFAGELRQLLRRVARRGGWWAPAGARPGRDLPRWWFHGVGACSRGIVRSLHSKYGR